MALGTIGAMAALASIPYVVEGGKKLWSEFSDPLEGTMHSGAGRAQSDALHKKLTEGLTGQIADVKGAAGSALGASLATHQGTGLTGFSPVGMAQAQQGEVIGRRAITDLEQQLMGLETQRFNDLIAKAESNVTQILGQFEYSKQRGEVLRNMAQDTSLTEAEREVYRNAASMYGNAPQVQSEQQGSWNMGM